MLSQIEPLVDMCVKGLQDPSPKVSSGPACTLPYSCVLLPSTTVYVCVVKMRVYACVCVCVCAPLGPLVRVSGAGSDVH